MYVCGYAYAYSNILTIQSKTILLIKSKSRYTDINPRSVDYSN